MCFARDHCSERQQQQQQRASSVDAFTSSTPASEPPCLGAKFAVVNLLIDCILDAAAAAALSNCPLPPTIRHSISAAIVAFAAAAVGAQLDLLAHYP